MKTMICLILDRSGSMQGREGDVIGGVNKFIAEQQALPDPASLAMVRFDSEGIERFRPMCALADVKPLKPADFVPRSLTPLLDAVGQTITALDEDWKKEKPERCIVMIVTDGQENNSREYTKAKVAALIKARQDSNLWAFLYLGADVDAFAEAGAMGIASANTAGYTKSAKGVEKLYASTSHTVRRMRATGSTLAHNLGVANLGEDDDDTDAPTTPPPASPASAAWTPPAGTASAPWTPPAGTASAPPSSAWTPPV